MNKKETILVLGGTGSCGKHFVQHALDAGHNVRVLTRSPEKITTERFIWAEHKNLQIHKGDLNNLADLDEACTNMTCVVSLAGPPIGAKTSMMPEAIRNTVTAMRNNGLKRLIVQTGGFVKLKGEESNLIERSAKGAFGFLMKEKATLEGNDKVSLFLQEECADIDWTMTRPGMLSDNPQEGVVEAAFDYGPGMPADHPSKVDLTRWYVDLLHDPKSTHKAIAPQYAKEDFGFAQQRVKGQKRIAVITGANSGLGYETARVLLLKGMQVVCACRNPQKAKEAVNKLRECTADRPFPAKEDISSMRLDVSSLESVRTFAQEYKNTGKPMHVLLCNAGIMMGPQQESVDGIDLQIATNYLGHFLLCNLLKETLIASAPARIVHVSSIAARMGSIDFTNLNPIGTPYNSLKVYQMSKLMQVVFSRELNKRLEGTSVTSNSLEPGIVSTNLAKGITDNPGMKTMIENGIPVEEGAKTQIFLCSSFKVYGKGGGNYIDCVDNSKGMLKFKYILAAHSLRHSVDSHLWEESEALIEKHSERDSSKIES
ncbi:MAG: hypothetical protein CL916_10060 [Deltaproteobacteria bacterium]|nr:hypothetical protein [Deltaproteobacteria bacterium]